MALVVFLKGVNVGGHRTFRPTVLAKQLKRHELVNIGAAGTFVVRAPVTQARLRADLRRRLPFDAEIMICTGADLLALGTGDRFYDEPTPPDAVRFVSILGKRPRLKIGTPLVFPPQGTWLVKVLAIENRFAFGIYRRAMKTISCLGAMEKALGVPVTTRNWNTIGAIVKVLGQGCYQGMITR